MLRPLLRRLLGIAVAPSFDDVRAAEERFYAGVLQPGMTAFDVGAHIGDLTLLMAQRVGDTGRVFAFEPAGATFAQLRQNVERGGLTGRVRLFQNAVADAPQTVTLHVYEGPHSTFNSLAKRPLERYGVAAREAGVEQVPAITLDAFCDEQDVRRIDLLKIDVEGAELPVLRGARRLLCEKRIGVCVFEFGQTTTDMGHRPEEIADLLRGCGYGVRNLMPGQRAFPMHRGQAQFAMHVAAPGTVPQGAA